MLIKSKIKVAYFVLVLMLFAQPLFADSTSMKGDMDHNITEMMRDIGDHMVTISGDLNYGTLNLEQQKAMAVHVRNMAVMMIDLAQIVDDERSDKHESHVKKIKNMRKTMDAMMKEISIGGMKPW